MILLMMIFNALHHPGTLTEVPNSGMPSRESMWEKAKAVLTPEEIDQAEASNTPLLGNVPREIYWLDWLDVWLGFLMYCFLAE